MIEGRGLRVTRLDREGNPTGEVVGLVPGSVHLSADLSDGDPATNQELIDRAEAGRTATEQWERLGHAVTRANQSFITAFRPIRITLE